jgi:hypothetical protein
VPLKIRVQVKFDRQQFASTCSPTRYVSPQTNSHVVKWGRAAASLGADVASPLLDAVSRIGGAICCLCCILICLKPLLFSWFPFLSSGYSFFRCYLLLPLITFTFPSLCSSFLFFISLSLLSILSLFLLLSLSCSFFIYFYYLFFSFLRFFFPSFFPHILTFCAPFRTFFNIFLTENIILNK